MTISLGSRTGRPRSRWRLAMWGGAAALLLVPLAAMQFTNEVDWDGSDFIVMGAILAASCGAFELAMRACGSIAYRAATGIAVVATFLLIWVNLAVGIIGSEDNPANLMYVAVIAIALASAIAARGRPTGMARGFAATGTAQAQVGLVALTMGLGADEPPGSIGILVLNAFFAGLWLLSAALFWKSAGIRLVLFGDDDRPT